MGDIGAHGFQHRADMREHRILGADHDREFPTRGGFPRAGDRRIGIGDAPGGQAGADVAGHRHRGGTGIDHDLAGSQQGLDFRQHRLHRVAVRQGQQDQVAGRGHLGRGHRLHAIGDHALQRFGALVMRHDFQAGAAGEMAAHRLPHHPQADETDDCDRP